MLKFELPHKTKYFSWRFLCRLFHNTCTFDLIIRKDVSLQAYNVAFARYLTTETRPDTKDWKVSATLFLDVKEYVTGTLSSTLFLDNSEQITYERQVSISPQHNSTSLVFSVSKVSSVALNTRFFYRFTIITIYVFIWKMFIDEKVLWAQSDKVKLFCQY